MWLVGFPNYPKNGDPFKARHTHMPPAGFASTGEWRVRALICRISSNNFPWRFQPGPPVVPFLPVFGWEGSPSKIDRTKSWYQLLRSSLLENLVNMVPPIWFTDSGSSLWLLEGADIRQDMLFVHGLGCVLKERASGNQNGVLAASPEKNNSQRRVASTKDEPPI